MAKPGHLNQLYLVEKVRKESRPNETLRG